MQSRFNGQSHPSLEDDEREIRKLTRRVQRLLMRRAERCLVNGVCGEAFSMIQGAHHAGEIVLMLDEMQDAEAAEDED